MGSGGARVGAGRKIIPMDIKRAKGTDKKHPQRELPATSNSKPIPPSWLNLRAKQIFRLIVRRLGERATASHTEVVSLLASRMEEVQRYDQLLNEKGVTYVGEMGMIRKRPEVELREKSLRHMHTLLVELGLTPSAANRVGKLPEKKKNNEFSEF